MDLLTYERKGCSAVITMCSPPLNVIDQRLRGEIRAALERAREDEAVHTVLLTGSGKAFMAGADINGFMDMTGKKGQAYDFVYNAYDVWYLLENLEKPTIAVINGLALGAGLEMALCCDILIASEKAKLGLPEIKLGLFPGGGGTQRLTRLIGRAKTKEMIFTGEPISAARAYEMGILNYVTRQGEEMDKAMAIAEKINGFSSLALKNAKRAVNGGADTTLRNGIELEANCFQEVFMGDDVAEGVAAFLEKREPHFR